jgi:hypothetical protein
VINEADLRQMSSGERRKLARSLAVLDSPQPLLGIYLARGRRFGALVSVAACAVLAGWIVVLLLTLHQSFHAQHWRGVWVGFDLALLVAFAATGWAFWRGRQIVIALLIVTATLLLCDAWFDVLLDLGSPDIWASVLSAVFVELPMAFLMFNAARRLIRLSALIPLTESGGIADFPDSTLPPLWKIPLFGLRPSKPEPPPLNRADRPRSGGISQAAVVDRQPRADLTSSPWLPISPRRPRPKPSSSPSGRTRTRGCARSSSRSCSTCTRSHLTSS